jgi:hypothetical protein
MACYRDSLFFYSGVWWYNGEDIYLRPRFRSAMLDRGTSGYRITAGDINARARVYTYVSTCKRDERRKKKIIKLMQI